MSGKSDNFWGGFFLGTAIGAVVGAVVAVKITQDQAEESTDSSGELDNKDIAHTLTEKIAQLNSAIDAVSAELAIKNQRQS